MIPSKPKQNRFRVVGSSPADADSAVNQNRDSAPETGSEGACPYCFGTGMEVVPGVGARRCRCQSPDYRERLFRAARIPPRYQHCNLANYVMGDPESLWKAKIEAQKILDDFLEIDGRELLFTGDWGVGKTLRAGVLLHDLIDRYLDCG